MNFYTLDYIIEHQSTDMIIRSTFIILLLAIVIITGFRFMKDRMKTRLRDISIGIAVFTFILLGIHVEIILKTTKTFPSHMFW